MALWSCGERREVNSALPDRLATSLSLCSLYTFSAQGWKGTTAHSRPYRHSAGWRSAPKLRKYPACRPPFWVSGPAAAKRVLWLLASILSLRADTLGTLPARSLRSAFGAAPKRAYQREQEKHGDQASGVTIYIMHAFHNAVLVYISAGMRVNLQGALQADQPSSVPLAYTTAN